MGEVRRARDTRLSRDVAIKFLRPDLAAQEQVRTRFEDEARNASQLTHPNVVTVYDSGEHNGQPYIVMECLPGHSLREEIAKGPIEEDRARVIATDVLAGLAAAHAAGIVHRDVAPSNILLTDDGHAKIADFGIAKAGEGLSTTLAGQVIGTPAYLSPSRLQGAPALPADDIYALGVVLYEAVTGERLFRGNTPVAVAQTVLNDPPPPLRSARPDLSASFAAAVDGAMARDSATRLTTAAAVTSTLDGNGYDQTAIVGVPVSEATTTMPAVTTIAPATTVASVGTIATAPPQWWQRTPREVWIAVVAIVFVGLLLLALASRGDDPATRNILTDESVPTTFAPTPTTIAPIPTTEVPEVPAVNIQVGGDRDDDDGPKGKGKAKRDD